MWRILNLWVSQNSLVYNSLDFLTGSSCFILFYIVLLFDQLNIHLWGNCSEVKFISEYKIQYNQHKRQAQPNKISVCNWFSKVQGLESNEKSIKKCLGSGGRVRGGIFPTFEVLVWEGRGSLSGDSLDVCWVLPCHWSAQFGSTG